MATYKIVRFFQNTPSEVQYTGLTLDEAQAHCNNPSTKGYGWFDGYEEEAVYPSDHDLCSYCSEEG